ncbi:MAG: AAA family ATPase [Victivallales bacterium]|jgi:MoxR-like ATPase|nr:AAA family ATPase [Victivallales bacterium]
MKPNELLTPEELKPISERAARILDELDRLLLGQHEAHRLLLIGILSRGHVLLEGLPGVGKTALVKALGALLSLDFKRIQFTPDLLPSDILGCNILQSTPDGEKKMFFQPGAIFTNILLADEINRASPKTQSAMLEAMQEHAVTLLGETRPLPEPFFVLASQNPIELEGTYPIPEAQLDRFLFKVAIKSVNSDVLARIIADRRRGETPPVSFVVNRTELSELFGAMEQIYLSAPVADYMARLVAAAHPGTAESLPEITQFVAFGASPRAAIALSESARAAALLAGRPTVGFEDVKSVAPAVLNHRLILNYQARLEKISSFDLVDMLLSKVDPAGVELPKGVKIFAGSKNS